MKELNTREMLSLRGGAHVVSNGLNQANRAVTIAGNRATSFMTHLETRGIHAIGTSSTAAQRAVLHTATALEHQITATL
jgi:hypothetical protein